MADNKNNNNGNNNQKPEKKDGIFKKIGSFFKRPKVRRVFKAAGLVAGGAAAGIGALAGADVILTKKSKRYLDVPPRQEGIGTNNVIDVEAKEETPIEA